MVYKFSEGEFSMGLFDFNGDGKTSFMEKLMAYNIYKASTKKEDTHDCWFYGLGEDYSWRDDCEDGLEYGIDAEDYETLEEYEDALCEAEYEDMRSEEEDGTIEIEVSFELEDLSDVSNKVKTSEIQRESHVLGKKCVHSGVSKNVMNDKNIYHYCSVLYENNPFPYHYRVNNISLNIGDKVIVPVGIENTEVVAEVVSVEQHTRVSVPYPIEECKFVIKKYDEIIEGE